MNEVGRLVGSVAKHAFNFVVMDLAENRPFLKKGTQGIVRKVFIGSGRLFVTRSGSSILFFYLWISVLCKRT